MDQVIPIPEWNGNRNLNAVKETTTMELAYVILIPKSKIAEPNKPLESSNHIT